MSGTGHAPPPLPMSYLYKSPREHKKALAKHLTKLDSAMQETVMRAATVAAMLDPGDLDEEEDPSSPAEDPAYAMRHLVEHLSAWRGDVHYWQQRASR